MGAGHLYVQVLLHVYIVHISKTFELAHSFGVQALLDVNMNVCLAFML
jgi:hypothetical protein